MRRRLLALLTLFAAWPGWAQPQPQPQPPAVNLGVELRFVPDGGELPRSGRGSVTVGTQGSTPLTGSVTVTTSTATAQRDESLLQLRVLNGARAQLRLSQLVPLSRLQWSWRGPAGPAAGGASGAAGTARAGLIETTHWVDTARSLVLRPTWPGGTAPVRVEVAVEVPGEAPRDLAGPGAGHSAGPRQLQLETTVELPLGEWFVLGRVGRPPSAPDASLAVSTSPRAAAGHGRIELRVLAP